MMTKFEAPTSDRLTVDRLAGSTVITLQSKKHWLLAAFMSFWVCGWTVGGLTVASEFLFGEGAPSEVRLFSLAWLGGWLVGEIFVIGTLLWMFFGRERITISLTALTHAYVVFVQFRKKNYAPELVRNMRFEEQESAQHAGWRKNSLESRNLRFEYGTKTVSMGRSIDRGEAEAIIAHIKNATGRDFKK